MKAILNGQTIAQAPKEDLIYIEGSWYFPLTSVKDEVLRESDTPHICPWKGRCQYYDVGDGKSWSKDAAFVYPEPPETAIRRVKKDFSKHIAFWRDVQVIDDASEPERVVSEE